MFLIIGLGNPGKKYENTRHNIGFMAVDEIAANFQFLSLQDISRRETIFNFQSILNAKISKGIFKNKKIALAKSQTFMNNSGVAVKKLIRNLKLEIRNLIVIHDDLDLPFGKIRIRPAGSSAGHKGLQSIINNLQSDNFIRIRIGIKNELTEKLPAEKFVLKKFNRAEQKILKEKILPQIPQIIETVLESGVEKAMNKYNG